MGNNVTSVRLPARLALVALLAAAAPALASAPASAAGLGAADSVRAASAAVPPLTTQPTAAPRPIDDSCPADQVPDARFTDVPASSPHKLAIDCVVAWGVANGRAPGRYEPAANVSRAQMATFIANAIIESGDELPQPSRDYFTDDNGLSLQNQKNINMLAEAGIIGGRGPGIYAPADPVGRGAMTKFLVESYEYTSGEQLPTSRDYFSDDNGTQFESYINAAASQGIASGSGSQYQPGGLVRRDQMASFVARWLDLVVERLIIG
jgi:hypothetical protein